MHYLKCLCVINFLEEIISKKRKIDKHETRALGEEYNDVVLNKLPVKPMDSDSFFIPYLIWNVSIHWAFCDLVSSVSLIMYPISKRLNLAKLRPTIYLQLANYSVKYHLGILEDVPIKVS